MSITTQAPKARAASKSASDVNQTPRILAVGKKTQTAITEFVAVSFCVPKAIADALEKRGKYSCVQSAWVAKGWENSRIKQWARDTTLDGKPHRRRTFYLARALKMPLDTKITSWMTPSEWQGVNYVCGELGITPAEWMLAAAAYNASVMKKSKAA